MAPQPTREITWELIHKRNSVERLKRARFPLDVRADLPRLIEQGYEAVPEEDFVRLQWWGLYHDKPKTGRLMMRIKLAGGLLTPAKLRVIGGISRRYGEGYGELTTRQNVQLHGIELAAVPEVLATLEDAGLTTASGCGDTVRNITGCPLSGLSRDELFDVRPVVEEAAAFFYGNREYSDLPRKHKITIAACPDQCNAPEIHCLALVGMLREGRPGFAVRAGGGLATWPRLADDLGVFVPREEVLEVLRALIDVWKEDLESRLSRARARLKFLVDRIGPQAYRQRVEERLGRRLEDGRVPAAPAEERDHTGVGAQKQDGLFTVGLPVFSGLVRGEQMQELADLAESHGGGLRLTRRQNLILTDVPGERVDAAVAAAATIGFPLAGGGLRSSSIACTGEPFCNYAVAETKHKLAEIVRHLEGAFGEEVAGLRLNLDGCPNACAHHWVGDLGLQGTTLRRRGPRGERLRGYDVFLRGGLGGKAAIGRPVLRRIPAGEVHRVLERLLRGCFERRRDGENVQAVFTRLSDDDIADLAAEIPAPATPDPEAPSHA